MTLFAQSIREQRTKAERFECPVCGCAQTYYELRERGNLYLFGVIPLGRPKVRKLDVIECLGCRERFPTSALHGMYSAAIAEIEMRGPALADEEEDVESTRRCPNCDREVSIHSRMCPRCETRL